MTMLDQPPELRDEAEDSHKLPDPYLAVERVYAFLRAFGDGVVLETWDRNVNDPHIPLYARDLEVLAKYAESMLP